MNSKSNYRAVIGFLLFSLLQWGCNNKEITGLYVQSVANPVLNINGTWHIDTSPEKEFWKQNEIDTTKWKEIQVPGEVMMQGFSIKNDKPFAYKKEVEIPVDYKDKNIYLQFDGVYSYTRVWVNGNFVRDHHGGFTRWTCDITPHVKAGEKASITVEVTDRADDISYASGYAKHQIGGILRDVNLLALPKNHPENIQLETDLDGQYKNSTLTLSGNLKNKGINSKLNIQLFDASKKEILLENNEIILDGEDSFQIKNTIVDPKKWDAEHPNLYTLKILYYENDELLWSDDKSFGFREVKVEGNQFLVNGKPVKLRGACRHDVHPTLGRVATPEYELKDVLLAKESNMNYIRTSHYPPSDNFLKLCDEYGIYVEDETAVCFVIDYRIKGYEIASKSQSDPEYTDRYLSQLEEMVNSHRNHPSVVIWSIGNESIYGANFQKSHDWIQENDKTRPIMFSYPGSTPDSIAAPYQILSMHYPPITGDLDQFDIKTKAFGYQEMPVIYDEWTHVACYNNATLTEDPNIRDFWGQSLDSMWIKTFDADGGLGGAIWGMIDETFMLPTDLDGFKDWWGIDDNTVLPYKGTTVGYGDWGIVDVWRRKKPEFWNTKKVYSPIKIVNTTIENYKEGAPVEVPIYNRFDHTNLKEITVKYTYNDSIVTVAETYIEPNAKGMLQLPILNWDSDKKIAIDFYDTKDNLIDRYTLNQKIEEVVKPDTDGNSNRGKVTFTESATELVVHTTKGDLNFDKKTGLLKTVEISGDKVNAAGPYMTYRIKGEKLTYSSNHVATFGGDENWKLNNFSYKLDGDVLVVNIKGTYKKIKASFELHIAANGEISTSYDYNNLPKGNVREIGVRFTMDPVFDALSWNREAYWSAYPKDHLSAPNGKVGLYPEQQNTYRNKPEKPWNEDSKSFYYEGTENERADALTNSAKATKENILEYALLRNGDAKLIVKGDGNMSCRLAKNKDKIELFLLGKLDYVDLNWGNYQRNILLDGFYSGEVSMRLDP